MSAETTHGWNKSHGGLGQMERMRREKLYSQIRCHLGVILPATASDQGSEVSFKNLALLLIPFPPWSSQNSVPSRCQDPPKLQQ